MKPILQYEFGLYVDISRVQLNTFKWNTVLYWCIQGYILNFLDLKLTSVCTSIKTIQHIYFLIGRLYLDVFQSRFYSLHAG